MDKKEIYNQIKKTIAKDGNSHQSTISKKGIVIDGKIYPYTKEAIIRDGKSHQGIRRKLNNK